ncbi:MAG: T9SS type A sorting domain-containing protein [candidate division KSB1 bacterium]|nr:T9SS type A sorting domain-containing protein [candidate division KSB1 bacterium]MDZ7385429.1 T9SS type A sorting domain-containing protein [candidate division KSB1 bacterium]MDZ7411925.1 T9SS type A sorting domain-containing protein [candidate division KSB1 bacterium]
MGRSVRWSMVGGLGAALLWAGLASAGTVDISCASGVKDHTGQPLKGNAFLGTGDLIQVIYVGANGINDIPDDFGNPTGDDELIGETFVGAGFPLNPDEGKFSAQFTHDRLAHGNLIYVRAWDGPSVIEATHYGDSQLGTVQLVGGFGAIDFPSWSTDNLVVAVELLSFEAVGVASGIRLKWVTATETENLGFELYRSRRRDGGYVKITTKLIPGAGNCQERRAYTYEDQEVDFDSTYYYRLADVDFSGRRGFHGPVSGVRKFLPKEYQLHPNFPNPFNPSTTIQFDLKEPGNVSVRIYNMLGQLVRVLVDQRMEAGRYRREWDGCNDLGTAVPSGLYECVMEVNGRRLSRRLVLMK